MIHAEGWCRTPAPQGGDRRSALAAELLALLRGHAGHCAGRDRRPSARRGALIGSSPSHHPSCGGGRDDRFGVALSTLVELVHEWKETGSCEALHGEQMAGRGRLRSTSSGWWSSTRLAP